MNSTLTIHLQLTCHCMNVHYIHYTSAKQALIIILDDSFKLADLLSPWLVLAYQSLLVTVAGSNGGGDHPIPAVVRRYCTTGVAGIVLSLLEFHCTFTH